MQKTKSLDSEISDGLKWIPTVHCPAASAALPLDSADLQPVLAFPPAAERFLRPVFFCIACTPVEAKHGSTEGRKAKRRLAFKICQLEGKHMSESDTASDVRYYGAGAAGGKNCLYGKDKKCGWGKRKMLVLP